MLASLVTRASDPMGEVAMLRRMVDDDVAMLVMAASEGCCWEAMGTNASEDGAQSATATARERNCMMMMVLLVYRLFGGDGFFLDGVGTVGVVFLLFDFCGEDDGCGELGSFLAKSSSSSLSFG